jgi:CheY-like chemotaxis protein
MPTPKILLVDDTRLFLELEKNFLKLSPAHVLTAGNGVEALESAKKNQPDLIFMDLNMPIMDGLTCCRMMKSDPLLKSIPIIMVTTAGREEDLIRCREAGCDDFLTKPISRRVFLEKGRKFLDGINRREPRVPCETPVRIKVHRIFLSGTSTDISGNGMYIASEFEIEEKTPVTLSFSLPESECTLEGITGRVVWQNCGDERVKPALPPGFGIEFQEVPEESAEMIRAYMAMRGTAA